MLGRWSAEIRSGNEGGGREREGEREMDKEIPEISKGRIYGKN